MSFWSSTFGKLKMILTESPAAGANSVQIDNVQNVAGGGFNLGNAGGNTSAVGVTVNAGYARRGVTQIHGGRSDKHAVGDCAAFYGYNYTDGGITAQSDEGASGITAQMNEYPGWFHGTVSSTTGTGDTAPVLAFTSGNAWTTDGGYLLNISKGTLSGTLTGTSTNLSLTINSGVVATFLNYLTVSGATLPISTAIGIATAAIANPNTTRDVPVAVSITVNLAQIGGIYKLFTNGSVVDVAGINYPEQSIVSGASGLLAGNQQTFTLHLCNPNSQAIIFQGGIQGNAISADANVMRSAYFAHGSLLGTDMIYSNQVTGNVSGNTLPNLGCENWTATGVNSAWHLYPRAEVVKNTNQGFACQLEQNGVAWANSDVVECARFPTSGGSTCFIVRNQYMPSNNSASMSGLSVLMNGPGIAGGNITGAVIQNNYTPANYSGSGGPLSAPIGLKIVGTWAPTIYVAQAPDAGPVIQVQSNNNAGSNVTTAIGLNYGGGGNLTYTLSTQRWHVDRMDSNIFSAAGVNGLSTTVGGLTFSGGILTVAGAGSGSIVITQAVWPGSVNLTTEGTRDWLAGVGSTAAPTVTPTYHSKLLGGWLRETFVWFGGTTFTFATPGITISATAADDIGGGFSSFSATGQGILNSGGGAINYGYRFRVPADTFSRTLRLYTGVFSGVITITCRVTDGSTADVTNTLTAAAGTSATTLWQVVYNSGRDGQSLEVTVVLTTNSGSTPNVTLQAATLF